MAINKVGRFFSLDAKDAAKLLPKEIGKLAAETKKAAGGGSKPKGK